MTIVRPKHAVKSHSVEETVALGKELAGILKSGDFLALTGPLGAGKTCFIKGVALGLGIDENEIKSPSFTLINEYYGRIPLYHFDLYRMANPSELREIGWDDYILRDGIIAVEWGEKAIGFLPSNTIDISFSIRSEKIREISISFNEKQSKER